MSIAVGAGVADKQHESLGVRHALLVCTSPRRLFGLVEDTGAYGWALAALIALVMLIGYTEVKTGLIDRSMDQRTEEALAALEKSQAHMIDRIELRERMDDVRKAGEFNKLLARLGGIVFAPAHLLASLLLIASVLYAVVALRGRKPEYHTLMSICVFSAFIELIGQVLRLAMVIYYRTTEVNTSLDILADAGKPSLLAAIEGCDLRLTREFITGYKPLIKSAPEQCELRSWLFTRES